MDRDDAADIMIAGRLKLFDDDEPFEESQSEVKEGSDYHETKYVSYTVRIGYHLSD